MKQFFFFFFLLNNLVLASTYPNKPIEIIVGFGKGGSNDRMTRHMASFLEEELKIKINVINIKGKATSEASHFLLSKPNDGYSILSSSLSPYLLNTILTGKAKFSLDDFAIINLQWFDYEFLAVNKTSKFETIINILDYIKENPKTLNVGIINKSSGNISFNLLLKKFNIPLENVNIKLYQGGKLARLSLLNSKIDVLIISAQGSEKYRDSIKPIAILSAKRSKRWDAPTIGESLVESGVELPIINGSIRGFIVSKKFKVNYPDRFKILVMAFKKILAKRKVQNYLKKRKIGYLWIGSEKSTEIIENSYDIFKKYHYLLKD